MNAVDTNVLIYACDGRDAQKQKRAIELLRALGDGVMLWQVAVEFLAAARRLQAQGFKAEDAWRRLDEMLVRFPLVCPTAGALAIARGLYLQRQMSIWDSMVLGACVDAGVTTCYSEDLPGSVVPGLLIVNPFRSP